MALIQLITCHVNRGKCRFTIGILWLGGLCSSYATDKPVSMACIQISVQGLALRKV